MTDVSSIPRDSTLDIDVPMVKKVEPVIKPNRTLLFAIGVFCLVGAFIIRF